MNKKILPVTYPPITTYTGYADALAILNNHEEAYDWIFSHYLQLFATQIIIDDNDEDVYPTTGYAPSFFNDYDNRRLSNCISDGIFMDREKCPYLNIFEMPNELIATLSNSYVDFFKTNIDLSMYIYGSADVSKIDEYGFKEGDLTFHPLLIYGYDDDEQVFFFADFLEAAKYKFSKCKYDQIEAAYQNINNMFLPLVKSIVAVKYNSNASFVFDFSYIQDTIYEYIYPDKKKTEQYTKYSNSFFGPLKWRTQAYIGLDTYTFMSKFLEIAVEFDDSIMDIRPFHALYDHKEMMLLRLDYLMKKGLLSPEKSSSINDYTRVRDNTKMIRNLILKYRATHNKNIINKINSLLEVTKEEEKNLLKAIFDIS